jgi:hypothetical protein
MPQSPPKSIRSAAASQRLRPRRRNVSSPSTLTPKVKEIAELNQVLRQRDAKLAEAQQAQADLIKKQRELNDAKREMDLTIQKQVQAELGAVRDKAKQETEAALTLKVREKEEQIASMQRQIEDLRRRAEQGSQQLQGGVPRRSSSGKDRRRDAPAACGFLRWCSSSPRPIRREEAIGKHLPCNADFGIGNASDVAEPALFATLAHVEIRDVDNRPQLIAGHLGSLLQGAWTAPSSIGGFRSRICHCASLQVATPLAVAFPDDAPDIYGQRLCACCPTWTLAECFARGKYHARPGLIRWAFDRATPRGRSAAIPV